MDAANYIEFHEIINVETKLYYYISGGKGEESKLLKAT